MKRAAVIVAMVLAAVFSSAGCDSSSDGGTGPDGGPGWQQNGQPQNGQPQEGQPQDGQPQDGQQGGRQRGENQQDTGTCDIDDPVSPCGGGGGATQ